jgi:O-methyltransferase
MLSIKRIMKRLLPRNIRVSRFRLRSTLLLDVDSVEYAEREKFFYNAFHTLAFNQISGDYTEFGCNGGMTFALAYQESRRHGHQAHLWAYDSFKGLPPEQGTQDRHPVWNEGSMATSLDRFCALCAATGVPRDAYTTVPGFYAETLEARPVTDAPTDICLAYIDCDLFSSTRSVLQFLLPRLKHGMIIGCDDYYCYSATQIAGERRALREAFEENGRWHLLPYRDIGWGGTSFIVEDKALL